MSKPISPDEVGKAQLAALPEEVFNAFNNLIARNWSGNSARITQEDAVIEISNMLDIERHVVFDKGLLNVEEAYRSVGWVVLYDKPGFNESYGAYFIFKKK